MHYDQGRVFLILVLFQNVVFMETVKFNNYNAGCVLL
jgi:hypothetical protein